MTTEESLREQLRLAQFRIQGLEMALKGHDAPETLVKSMQVRINTLEAALAAERLLRRTDQGKLWAARDQAAELERELNKLKRRERARRAKALKSRVVSIVDRCEVIL